MLPTAIEVAAREKGAEVKMYKVIYDLYDDVIARLNTLLPQEKIVNELGVAEVAAIFRTENNRMVVGLRTKEGKLLTGAKVRVFRGNELEGDGVIESLQSGKSVVKEIGAGMECGMSYAGKVKLMPGDKLEAFTEELKARKLEAFR
jgi:translation initiation factor IF-2